MTNEIDREISEIQNSDAVNVDGHEGYREAADRLNVLFQQKYDGVQGESKHQREMREWSEGVEPMQNPEDRRMSPDYYGDKVMGRRMPDGSHKPFSWHDEVPREDHFDRNPDIYEFDDEDLITRDEKLEMIHEGFVDSEEGIKRLMRDEGVELDSEDVANMRRLTSLGQHLGMSEENIQGAFQSVVRNPDYQKTFTNEEGERRLLEHYCDNDPNLCQSVIERAQQALGELDQTTIEYLDSTGLGSNPAVLIAFSNMIESKFGSALDEPGSYPWDSPWEEEE